jgi:FAD/FMN-containing dehydrogenase
MKELPRRRFLRDAPTGLLCAAAALQPTTLHAADGGDVPWSALAERVGELVRVRSPLEACLDGASPERCDAFFKSVANPWYIGDEVGLTQSLGWVDAWTSRPSAWAVVARTAQDVAAAVDFAREHGVRLVVKGGGHSYHGASCAADSLLVWTRRMSDIVVHDAFVPADCTSAPVRAISIGAGAVWAQAYAAATTQAGAYVQGGGCLTVGVAGLVLGGGFGSFSKAFGTAASSLLEVEVVTADGKIRIVNACKDPDLFWALKGGAGGSFGIVTRLTLRLHELPEVFGVVSLSVHAASGPAFRRLIGQTMDFCARHLVDPHWGEQLRFRRDNTLQVMMVFQGLTRAEAKAVWQPFLDLLTASDEYSVSAGPLAFVSTSARDFWAPSLLKRLLGLMKADDRDGAPTGNVYWAGDASQAGQVIHGYASTWLPAALIADDRREALADALFEASRHWGVSLHLNKGLAGAPESVIAAARDTATNPVVCDAFALAISASEGPPAYPGVAGHEPDIGRAREQAKAIALANAALRRLVPQGGSYVSESDYFEADWQRAFWGDNYPRLAATKAMYDPQGIFVVHHGVQAT